MDSPRPTQDRYTTQDVADRLSVGTTTIKTWAEKLGIDGEKSSGGKRYFSNDDVRLFETIKALREEDKGLDTIYRIVRPQPDTNRPETDHGRTGDGRDGLRSDRDPVIDINALVDQIEDRLEKKIDEKTDLAERFGQIANINGRLEAKVEFLESQLEERGRLLTDGSRELDELKTRLAKAEAERDQLKEWFSRSWWQRLLRK